MGVVGGLAAVALMAVMCVSDLLLTVGPGIVLALGACLAMGAVPRSRRLGPAGGMALLVLGVVWMLFVRVAGCGDAGSAPPVVYVTTYEADAYGLPVAVAGALSALVLRRLLRSRSAVSRPASWRGVGLVVMALGSTSLIAWPSVRAPRGTSGLFDVRNPRAFDSSVWRSVPEDDLSARDDMVRDYLRRHRPIGRHRAAIEGELGAGDSTNSAFEWAYGMEGFMDPEELLLWFDTDDRCLGWEVVQH